MAKFTTFKKDNIKEIRDAIQTKLNELKEIGLNAALGNIKFDAYSLTSPITATIEGGKSQYEIEFLKRYYSHCFKGDEVGKEFIRCGHEYKFLGFVPRARTLIALIEDIRSNKKFRIDASEALRFLSTGV
mgnify:CR=1 FL=1